jgi:hypothetical protein
MVTNPSTVALRQSKRRSAEAISAKGSRSQSAKGNSIEDNKRRRVGSSKDTVTHTQSGKAKATSRTKNLNVINDGIYSKDGTLVEYSWSTKPWFARANIYYGHVCVRLTSREEKRVFNIRHGGSVRLTSESGKDLFCRVNRFSSRATTGPGTSNAEIYRKKEATVKVEGCWLLHRNDLEKHFGNVITPECQENIKKLQHNELVLTNCSCALDIAGVEGNIRIIDVLPNEEIPSDLPPNTYICRFYLKIDVTQLTLEWCPINHRNLDAPAVDDFEQELHEVLTNESVNESPASSAVGSDYESDASSSVEEISNIAIREGGNSTLRTEIRVGAEFQVDVQKYTGPLLVPLTSRKPMLMYKANAISDDELLQFLNEVADIHNKYLFQNGILMEEPYTPLVHNQAEMVMKESPEMAHLTGSSMSTASMLAGSRCRLKKECDADAILEILAHHDYDPKTTLITIQGSLDRITAGWTRHERNIFDDAFRRNNGSIKKITKLIAPTKNVKDVIDYFYRFKVSDQFRKFQDKKRAVAVRIVECIEARKTNEVVATSSNNGQSAGSIVNAEPTDSVAHWSEKSTASMASARDDRIHAAKRLLLDVKDCYGSKKMAEVASVIRQLQECYEGDGRRFLFKLLEDQPELQRRFLEFLPKHL